ncbi:MAG: hypothetical protein ACOVRN_16870 [Flavobacterium sp.]
MDVVDAYANVTPKLATAYIDAKLMGTFQYELAKLKSYIGQRWSPHIEHELAALHNDVVAYSADEFDRIRDLHLGRFHRYDTRWLGCLVTDDVIVEMDLFWVPDVKNHENN